MFQMTYFQAILLLFLILLGLEEEKILPHF